MRTLLRYLKPYSWRIALQMTIKMLGTVAELLLPSLLSILLDNYAPVGDMHGVIWLGCGMLMCALLACVGNITANRMSTNVTRRFIYILRRDLFRKVTQLSAAQQDHLTDASLVSRLSTDTYNVNNMVDRLQRLGVRAPIMLMGGILVSLTLDPVLTLVLIATLPLLALVVILTSRKGVPLFTLVQEGQDHMVRKVQENMTGARVIRALSRTQYERDAFEAVNEDLARRQRTADMTMAMVSPIVNLVLNTGLAMVVLVGAWRVYQGTALPGTIIAFLSYFTVVLNAMLSISRLFVIYSKGSASARRIEEVLLMPEDLLIQDAPAEATDAHIAFRNVSFSYNKQYDNLQDITFQVAHGQTLGIIGPTGSGKSTLLALLLRQYDPDQGQILLDGKPVSSLPPEELHAHLGVVFQNDFLMADTIRENIRFGRDVSEGSLQSAIDCAQAGFIRRKEGGLDFPLNVRGRNLSGGQQQRVLICRALAGDPRLLLLDDCSSALDFRTDLALRTALRQRHGEATTIIVAQRVSSVMAADLILVMDKGRIIGTGTHQQLLESCPMYRDLTRMQLGGEAV